MTITRKPTLLELGVKHNTDKVVHRYLPLYEDRLASYRESVSSVCEIGVQTGASLRMWAEFFPNARIYGLDIDEHTKKEASERISIHIVNAANANALESLQLPEFDIVVDDGSHQPADQILSFQSLFPHLREGGMYFIEDMYTKHFGSGALEYFLSLVQKLYDYGEGSDFIRPISANADWWTRNVRSIEFLRFFTVITRGLAINGPQ